MNIPNFLFLGTGKTFVANAILAHVRSQGDIALAMASTGIAALLLKGGRTVHNRCGLPIDLKPNSVCNVKKNSRSWQAQVLREAKVLVLDEAPMAHRYALECLDRTLRDRLNINEPFGGKIMGTYI